MSHFISGWWVAWALATWMSLFVYRDPLTFLMVQGVVPPPAAAKWGFLFSSSALIPTPFLFILTTALTMYSKDGA